MEGETFREMTDENTGSKSLESNNSSSTTLDGRNPAPPRFDFYTSQLNTLQ